MSKKTKKLYYIFLPFAALLLALGIAADCLYPMYDQVINNALGSVAKASPEYIEEALKISKDVNIQLQEEGSVLMKNNGVLPIDTTSSTPVNVYGVRSAHHFVGSSGSSSTGAAGVNFKTALESVNFSVNADLWNLLDSQDIDGNNSGIDEGTLLNATVYEIPLDKYNETVSWSAAKNYSPYAIVTFGRSGAEGSDFGRGDESTGKTSQLELSSMELALLQKLHTEGFKVISLINCSNVVEMGPFMEYSDAVLWIGGTGLYGTYGVANILAGKANPSGRAVDTWMYEQETSSTYYTTMNLVTAINEENKEVTVSESIYVDSNGKTLGAYTNYNEGIYVGYKWYETADAEGYWSNVSNSYGTGYEGVVACSFGAGLSYTTFTEEFVSASYEEGVFTFEVKAKNTGDMDGKDVIEIYVEKPYVDGGLEMSKVELVAFDKTETLAKGTGEETITLTVNEEDLACYDVSANNGNGCYVLAGGEYKFYLASAETGAHIWKTADESRVESFNVDAFEYSGENKRSGDSVVATNLLEVTTNDTKIKSNDATAGFKELSRANHFANAAQTISKEANGNNNVLLDDSNPLYAALTANYGTSAYKSYNTAHLKEVAETTNATLGQKKTYTLVDLYTTDANGNPLYEIDEETGVKTVLGEVDYDDPRWEVLLSQLSVSEMSELIGKGGYGTIKIDSIGKPTGIDYDGPTGFSSFLKATLGIAQETTGFCTEPIMAATWNVELLEDYGRAVGREGNAFSNTGWYAPGMNMHRTPFGGRMGEYFSEDPFITGMMGAAVAGGAFEMGVYTYAKHFAFNEIETNRNGGMNCWMSEQTAREVYLRPFEIAIKQGKLTGLMSSFMFFNAQWNGGDFNLMTGIVRREWNFKGVINTDLAGNSIMGAEKAICAGTDMLLGTKYGTNAQLTWMRCDTISKTDDGICAMKTATKHILYAYASAALNREVAAEGVDTSGIMALYVVINIIGYGGAAALIGLFAWRLVLDLKRSSSDFEVVDSGASPDDEKKE